MGKILKILIKRENSRFYTCVFFVFIKYNLKNINKTKFLKLYLKYGE